MRERPLLEVAMDGHRTGDKSGFPFSIPAISQLRSLSLDADVVFFVGENGSGKSTLIEALAVSMGFNAEGGSRNFRFQTRATHSELHEYIRVARGVKMRTDGFFFRGETFYNLASEIDRLDEAPSFDPPIRNAYGGKSLHRQSHGEAFMATIMNRFRGGGLYLLDEPEAALSPQRQLSVLARMIELVTARAQFVVATHSPVLLAFPDALIYEFSDRGIQSVRYEDTSAYRVMSAFMASPQRIVRLLRGEE